VSRIFSNNESNFVQLFRQQFKRFSDESATLWVFNFKLSVQNVHQLLQHMIEVSFEITGLRYQWTAVADHSISIARQSSAWQCWSVLACSLFLTASQHRGPTHHNPITWDMVNSVAIRFFQWNQDISEFNYLFTLKNAHLTSNSYNFWMQQNIAMKYAGYVAWVL